MEMGVALAAEFLFRVVAGIDARLHRLVQNSLAGDGFQFRCPAGIPGGEGDAADERHGEEAARGRGRDIGTEASAMIRVGRGSDGVEM